MSVKSPMKELRTVDEVLEALGGTKGVQLLIDAGSPQQVSNWRTRGIPARHYLVMIEALKPLGFTACSEIWGVDSPPLPGPATESAGAAP